MWANHCPCSVHLCLFLSLTYVNNDFLVGEKWQWGRRGNKQEGSQTDTHCRRGLIYRDKQNNTATIFFFLKKKYRCICTFVMFLFVCCCLVMFSVGHCTSCWLILNLHNHVNCLLGKSACWRPCKSLNICRNTWKLHRKSNYLQASSLTVHKLCNSRLPFQSMYVPY